jgi:hypothetical protein
MRWWHSPGPIAGALLVASAPSCAAPLERPAVGLDPHPCHPEELAGDFWNCGACAAACDVADTDWCAQGQCRCGPLLPCGAGADCRRGSCVHVDPEGAVCEFDADCGRSHACIEGRCSPLQCDVEVCDGVDNDCDGLVDEGDSGGPLSEWCPEAEDTGPCESSVRVCTGGRWSDCMGGVAPRAEVGRLRCDGVDDDCDGCVDGSRRGSECVSEDPRQFDVVFLIDVSGSMIRPIEDVREAVASFSARFAGDARFRFAIVAVPSRTRMNAAAVDTDLVDFETFQSALGAIEAIDFLGLEPQLDALYEVGTGELALGWREGSVRILVLFTDEEAQTYRSQRGLGAVDEVAMCGAMQHGETVAVETSPDLFGAWDLCSITLPLGDADVMSRDLAVVIADPCS